MLIQKLKDNYDWIFIDTPPVMAVPDALTVGSFSDGVILTVGLDCRKSHLKKVRKVFNVNHVSIFGIITRELQTGEAASGNEYIKQLISRMMPQDDILQEK